MGQSIAIEASPSNLVGSQRERIIRKIKRCLALGESSNQNEAEVAMRQAQAMMRAYRLNAADIDAHTVGSSENQTGLIRMSEWQRRLAATAAAAFHCKLILSRSAQNKVKFIFVGVVPAAELSAYAYDTLLTQVTAARKRFQEQNGGARRAADDFCLAWVYAVRKKVVDFAVVPAKQLQELKSFLGVLNQEHTAIDAWIARQSFQLKILKQVKRNGFNVDAGRLGAQAGERAVINKAVYGAPKTTLFLD